MPTFKMAVFVNSFFLVFLLLLLFYYAFRTRLFLNAARSSLVECEKYRALFKHAADGVFRCDRNGQFTMINRAGMRILGIESTELLVASESEGLSRFFGRSQSDELLSLIEQGESIVKRCFSVLLGDGRALVLEISAHPYREGDNGPWMGVEGIFRDLTDRVALEEDVKIYSEKLEDRVKERTRQLLELENNRFRLEKLAAMGQMAAMIVHEIRNPLSSIKVGLTSLVKRPYLNERDLHTLHLSIDEMEILEKSLQDMLYFAKPEELHRAWHQLNDVVGLIQEQMKNDFAGAGIKIKTDLSKGLPSILIDTDRIGQVLINILLNARQAIDGNGRVIIKTWHDAKLRKVFLSIADNGCGMTDVEQKRLFEPFYTARHDGTGLGMTLVEKIVAAHGGSIEVFSEKGKGTTVRIGFSDQESF